MKFQVTVAHKDNINHQWTEIYDRNVDDPEQWAKETIESFNNTLRPYEKPRQLIKVEIMNQNSVKDHDWEKTNLVTIITKKSLYDTYKCKRCGITGKRFGLDSHITLDPKYRCAKVYQRCDTSCNHQQKIRNKEKP